MSVTVHEVLDDMRAKATSERDKGSRFEQLMAAYLQTDPLFADQFSDVWLWQDWPGREGKTDTGIDLVAVDRVTGENVAIQCKFYAENHTVSKGDIDSFLSASGTSKFGQRVIVDTGAPWGKNAEDTIRDQTVKVRRISLADLQNSNVDWSKFTWSAPDSLPTVGKKTPRPHQRTAIDKVLDGLKTHDRGKLIMACGTGKTFTSLRLAEEQVGAGGSVLFLVPSISLLSQTVREWSANKLIPQDAIAICSDPKSTSRSNAVEDISAVDVALPASTNNAVVQERWAKAAERPESMTVILSTYQSIDVVAGAQAQGGFGPFDLIICDEAHRTTGVSVAGQNESAFVRVHNNDVIQGTKRLYMTATPRIFGEDSKKKAFDGAAELASMDDESKFGPELHRLGFGEAVEKNLLTDYRVLILAVDEEYVTRNFQTELAQDGEIQLGDAARMVGCWQGLAKHFDTVEGESLAPMKRAVAFAKDIKTSKAIAQAFPDVVNKHVAAVDLPDDAAEEQSTDLKIEIQHVDGSFNALARNERLDWLKAEPADNTCRILTNARCLSEGVDVPNLDAVLFLTPRSSEADVVQSVGRVMRKAPGKEYGYIILPVAVPAGTPPEQALNDNKKYATVWQVLRALRAHDDRFTSTVNQIELNKKKPTKKIGIAGIDADGNVHTPDEETTQGELDLIWGEWSDAIYAKIVQKVGERRYWESWAADVAKIAEQHIARINGILTGPDNAVTAEFERFLDGLRGNLNEGISRDDAVEMLAQHLITRPVFEALFGGYDFAKHNPVAQAMERMLALFDEHSLDTENSSLEGFYASVRSRVEGIDNAEGRQRIIVELYDKFFATAFKRTVDKLGIVYTPVEIVDFILRSADAVLREHFGQTLSDEGVHILDGFVGTGTFIVRLLQLGLIEPHDLARKYAHELHANEILLLAYYIAAVNIETTYQDLRGSLEQPTDYEPFEGLILTDTFQSWENDDRLDTEVFVQNNERLAKLKKLDIQVIVGNPPYSVGQDSANDNNANEKYPDLDAAIRRTYAENSSATLLRNLYDSYVRAIKWASLQIKDRGVIAYVTNGGWLESNAFDGMRKSLTEEFSDIYVYNLRGNQRTAGEQSRKEGGKVFDAGSRATVAITVLVKDPAKSGPATIHYTDIGDYLTREQKLAKVAEAADVKGLEPLAITPNEHGDWLNQRQGAFADFLPLSSTDSSIFTTSGPGILTNRDAWVSNFSQNALRRSVGLLSDNFNRALQSGLGPNEITDTTQISWTRSLRKRFAAGKLLERGGEIRTTAYRPFMKQRLYFTADLIEVPSRMASRAPTGMAQQFLSLNGPASNDPFGALIVSSVPNLHLMNTGHYVERYRYVKVETDLSMLSFEGSDAGVVIDDRRRIDNITDEALMTFQAAYGTPITKDDIFFYVYGLLHSPDYRETYAADLKKMLPRIPLVEDAQPFIDAGRRLSELHLGYETVEPYPLEGLDAQPADGQDPYAFYAVGDKKMRFGKPSPEQKAAGERHDRTTIHYNSRITLAGIPQEAYRYMLGSRSAIEWIIDRYYIKTDKASGIVNDPNDWSKEVGDPRYIIDLLARIVTVSLETMRIVDALPPLAIREVQ
ncbi:type ISP restriction/modification enzyme [Dermacoccus sp. Ellin185]|uniref:DEAD/DEAH box helicase n=1 Tax=Dermacoccus sp. Ellin185 TaxID=188626 RepID=UPI000586CC96|nr:type ISP restriction/modification enzyme [Dermacoccus sp. Ellin185]HCQ19323.1 damage-inducible protein [Dermacoccus sp.]